MELYAETTFGGEYLLINDVYLGHWLRVRTSGED